MSPSTRMSAAELISLVADPGSWESWDNPSAPVVGGWTDRIGAAYAAELRRARETSGCDGAVITGTATIRGRQVAAVVGEFGFMAGSIGTAEAARIIAAIARAIDERLPLVAAPVSGGTRLQEGPLAFVQMATITQAIIEHRAAGLPYLVYLRDPTVGGVLASWGSLGHVTVGEPGALIGFTGPRVYESLHGRPFPPGVQVAENLLAHGLLDAVVPPHQLAGVAARALDVLAGPRPGIAPVPPALWPEPPKRRPAWDVVTRSRLPHRISVRSLLRHGTQSVTPLSGTGEGETEATLALALARFGSVPAVVIGHDRLAESEGQRLGPAALRTARRGMRLASELRLPLVTVIDTAGAALSPEAEEGGLAAEIARCLADLLVVASPTLCLLLGQGAGGAALALMPADRVIAAENSWLSPMPPEGASVVRHRSPDHAPTMAEELDITAVALLRDGIVDRVIAEPDTMDASGAEFARLVAAAVESELAALLAVNPPSRLRSRIERYGRLGSRAGGTQS